MAIKGQSSRKDVKIEKRSTKSANDTKPSGITKHYHCWLCFMKDGNNFCLASCENLEKDFDENETIKL